MADKPDVRPSSDDESDVAKFAALVDAPVGGGAVQVDAPGGQPAAVKSALQAAGNLNWNSVDDPDGVKEPLVNVDAF
jgi:hypothetical protein